MADLGLAYLMNGQKEKGLNVLHEAQALFRSEGRTEDLAQSLRNEAMFFDQAGDKPHADALRREATACLADRNPH